MDPITRLDLLGPGTDTSALEGEPTAADLAELEAEFQSLTGTAPSCEAVLPPRPDDAELEAAIAARLPGLGAFFARGSR